MQTFLKTIEKEATLELPKFLFGGRVILVDKPEDVGAAIEALGDAKIIGFDTETKPAFKKGEYHQVSLLQLGTIDTVCLFRLNKCGFTPQLRKLLSDKSIEKIGVGIRDDQSALSKIASYKPAGFVDLQDVVTTYGIEEKSFSKLMAIIFGVRISKKQRVTNWDAESLTEAQIRYAATDAWGACAMYLKIRELSSVEIPDAYIETKNVV